MISDKCIHYVWALTRFIHNYIYIKICMCCYRHMHSISDKFIPYVRDLTRFIHNCIYIKIWICCYRHMHSISDKFIPYVRDLTRFIHNYIYIKICMCCYRRMHSLHRWSQTNVFIMYELWHNHAKMQIYCYRQVCLVRINFVQCIIVYELWLGLYCELQIIANLTARSKTLGCVESPSKVFFLYSCVVGIKKRGPKSFRNGRSNLQLFCKSQYIIMQKMQMYCYRYIYINYAYFLANVFITYSMYKLLIG